MNGNEMIDSTLADATVLGNGATGYNPAALPEIAYFRVQSRGAVGTYSKGLHERKVGAWALLVSCKDGKGLRLMSDVLFEKGMKGKCEYATYAEAVEAGKKAKKAWGHEVEKKAKRAKLTVQTLRDRLAAKGMTEEEIEEMLKVA